MAQIVTAMAALTVPYVPQVLHMDPLRLGSSHSRARALTVMVRSDVFTERGAFMPPLAYQTASFSSSADE